MNTANDPFSELTPAQPFPNAWLLTSPSFFEDLMTTYFDMGWPKHTEIILCERWARQEHPECFNIPNAEPVFVGRQRSSDSIDEYFPFQASDIKDIYVSNLKLGIILNTTEGDFELTLDELWRIQ